MQSKQFKILNKYLFIVSMFFTTSLYCMDKQITEAYTVPLSTKYYRAKSAVQAAIVSSCFSAAATYATQESFDQELSSLILPLALAATVGSYYCLREYNKPALVDRLLTDATNVLAEISKSCVETKKFHTEAENCKETITLDELRRKQEDLISYCTGKRGPIFYLGECGGDGHFCALNRSYNSGFRENYEHDVVALLTSVAKREQEQISYVSFGCGGLYQDLTILTKFFSRNPSAVIDMHFIDKQDMTYVNSIDFLTISRDKSLSREIVKNKKFTFPENQFADYKKSLKNTYEEVEKMSLNSFKILEAVVSRFTELKYQQLTTFLQNTFPKAKITTYIHGCVKYYLSWIEEKSYPAADVVVTADIQR